jgi:hypothetical protein
MGLFGAILGGIGSILGGISAKKSAKRADQITTDMVKETDAIGNDLQKYGDISNQGFATHAREAANSGAQRQLQEVDQSYRAADRMLQPYAAGGQAGFEQYTKNLLDPNQSVDQLRNTPGYEFALDQGVGATNRGFASRGTLLSGARAKALNRFGTGLADQTYQTHMDRLNGLGQMGLQVAGQRSGMQVAAGTQRGGIIDNQTGRLIGVADTLNQREVGLASGIASNKIGIRKDAAGMRIGNEAARNSGNQSMIGGFVDIAKTGAKKLGW